jgi:hypothetical protein
VGALKPGFVLSGEVSEATRAARGSVCVATTFRNGKWNNPGSSRGAAGFISPGRESWDGKVGQDESRKGRHSSSGTPCGGARSTLSHFGKSLGSSSKTLAFAIRKKFQ